MSKLINKEALRQSLIKVKQYIDDKLFGNSESLKDLISEEISKGLSTIVDSAPEAFDTLKEVADWIAQDETHSAGIIESINKNTQSINEIKNTKADSALSLESENPVMNKVITEELNKINRNLQDIPTDIVTEESLSFELNPYWFGIDPKSHPDNPILHYRKNPVVFYSTKEGVSALEREMYPLLVWRTHMLIGGGATSIFVRHSIGNQTFYVPATITGGSQGFYLIWEDKENHYELLINNTNTQPTITPKQPDWLINTASHNGFIKNKTHGLNVYDVFIDGAKMMVGNDGTGVITWSKETSFGNVADSNIALLINNNIYPILEAISEEDFLPNEDNTIKSMPIVVAGNSGVIHVNRVSGTTIKIGITIPSFEFMSYSLVGYRSIQQLSELFIPNTIARTEAIKENIILGLAQGLKQIYAFTDKEKSFFIAENGKLKVINLSGYLEFWNRIKFYSNTAKELKFENIIEYSNDSYYIRQTLIDSTQNFMVITDDKGIRISV